MFTDVASRLLRSVATLLLALLLWSGPAQAKLVAIVFDTSGSMSSRYQLPRFGMELLAATIDGRAGFDRLWTLNFNQYAENCNGLAIPEAATIADLPCDMDNAIRKYDITNADQHTNAVKTLAADFIPAVDRTPYGPLEVMLDEIARSAEPGEDVILIVVTDGLYHQSSVDDSTPFDGGVYIPQMQRSFAEYRKRILDRGVNLSAEFLFIDGTGTSAPKVAEQGVQNTLLATFNENAATGSWHVTNEAALWSALTEIVARVSGTDREAQHPFVTYSGSSITVESPLSISRMVIVATGDSAANLPGLTSPNISGTDWTDRRSIDAQMEQGDEDFDFVQKKGEVTQLWFHNAIPAGRHKLDFDGPVDDGVFLLFETSALTDLRLFDDQGQEVRADAQGNLTVFIGRTYEFRSRILDGLGVPEPVDFDLLPPALAMFLTLSSQAGKDVSSMTIERNADEGRWQWTPSTAGEVLAQSRATAGLLSPQSVPLNIVVMDAVVEITVSPLTADPASPPCPTCATDEVVSPIVPGNNTAQRVATFEVTAKANQRGQIDLGGSTLPEGYELRLPNGDPLATDQLIDMGPAETVVLEIWRIGEVSPERLARGLDDIAIEVQPAGGWTGPPASRAATVRLNAPNMSMPLVETTQPIAAGPDEGLLVPGHELTRGQFVAQFELQDILLPPDPEQIDDLVTVTTDGLAGWLLSFETSFADPVATGFNSLDVRPHTRFFCLCMLGLGNAVTGDEFHHVTVRYAQSVNGTVIQSAQTPLLLQIPIARVQMGLSCLLNLLALVLLAMFMGWIVALFRSNRFPKGAVIEIQEGNSVPRFKRLDTKNSYWWKGLFCIFTRRLPHEWREVEGLRIAAAPRRRGGIVDITRAPPPWRVERLGESFEELKENNPKKMTYALMWGDRLENTHQPALVMRLKKRSSDI